VYATKVVKMMATMKMMTVVVAALQRLQEGRREGIIVFGGDGLTAVQGQWEEGHCKVAHVGEPPPSRCGLVVLMGVTQANLMGLVRTMNMMRKIALVTMVVRAREQGGIDGGNGNDDAMVQPNDHIAIADLALEKVLTAHANVRKGSTTKQ